jgi:hypothetical protein
MQPCDPCASGIFSIFQGDAKTLTLQAVIQASNLQPLDLTSATEIIVQLPLAAGGYTALKLSLSEVVVVSPANLGTINVPISAVTSALLNVGSLQDIFVTYTITGMSNSPMTVSFPKSFSVFE